MIVELSEAQMRGALPLFGKSPHHRIARACCEGLVQCRMFVDRARRPTAALVSLSRFGIAFAAGDARFAGELLEALRGWHPWYEVGDPPSAWYPALAAWSRAGHATVRYGFATEEFDVSMLRALATPPEGLTLCLYDRPLVEQALSAQWSEDQIGVFCSADDFLSDGMGMALVDAKGGLLAGCVSFCRVAGGYEIQIDTHPEHRGKGYASCVGAAFILQALLHGQKVCWDAANKTSMRLAEKLGFVFTEAFPAWMLIGAEKTADAVAEKVIGE